MSTLSMKNIWLCMAVIPHIHAATVSSSAVSASTPLTVTENTTITMTSDIIITSGPCPLIVAGAGFGSSAHMVDFNSSTGNKIIIQNGGTWDPATITGPNMMIQFSGNTQLICQEGGKIVLSGLFNFTDTSQLIEQQGITIQLNGGTLRMGGNSTLTTQVP